MTGPLLCGPGVRGAAAQRPLAWLDKMLSLGFTGLRNQPRQGETAPHTVCLTLSKSRYLSESQFLHL